MSDPGLLAAIVAALDEEEQKRKPKRQRIIQDKPLYLALGGQTPSGPTLPQVASATLLLDLEADTLALSDGDPVSTWADQSGNGHDFTQSAPSFPTTGILDDFNRADDTDIAGSMSWITGLFGQAGIDIFSSQARCTAAASGYRNNVWNQSFTDTEVYATLVDVNHGFNEFAIGARFSGSGSTPNGYFLYWLYNNGGGQTIGLYRFDNGSATQLGSNISVSLSNGDKIGLSIIGSTLTAYTYTNGAWASIGTRTDATYGSAGNLWFYGKRDNTEWLCDDFGGGEYVDAQPIKQTISGYPAVVFDGVDDWMLGSDFADSLSSFAIFTIYTVTGGDSVVVVSKLGNPDLSDPGWELDDLFWFVEDNGGNYIAKYYDGSVPSKNIWTAELVSFQEAHLYLNGNNNLEQPDAFGTVANSSTTQPVRLAVNGKSLGVGTYLGMNLYSVLVYQITDLDNWPTDRAAITAWLATRYGVTL